MKSVYHRQILFLIFLFIAFLLIIGAMIYSGTVSAKIKIPSENNTKKMLLQYKSDHNIIFRDEKVKADIVITDGSLTISGEIYGDVIALQSVINIKQSGIVYGNVVCYNGEANKENGAKIAGDIINAKKNYVEYTTCHDIEGYKFPYHIFALPDTTIEMKKTRIIEKDENITGDLIILDEEFTINGKIDGDIIGLASEIQISETAAVDGHVINYDGIIDISPDALITGEIFNNSTTIKSEQSVKNEEKIRKAVEKKYLKHRNANIVRFLGDVTIEENEIINGEVVVMKGNAIIRGEVNGEVVTIFGNVEMDSTAYVSGDVVSVGGRIYRDKGSYVGGDVVQTTWTGVTVDEGTKQVEVGLSGVRVGNDKWEKRKVASRWHDEDIDTENFMIRYNRVEGLFLGLRLPRYYWDDVSNFHLSLYGHAGYGFQNKRSRYQIGLERWFFNTFRFTIGAEAHDITDTQDKWIISTFENSLAAFLIKEDFHDFYRREGASGYLMQNITPDFRLIVGYRKDRFYNMEKKTNWSIFGGKKKFRANPSIDEINMKSLYVEIGLDTRNSMKFPTQGWFVNLMGEFAGRDLNNNGVDFDRFIFDIRRYQPIGYGENLDFRLRLGTSRGRLPLQFCYDLGGISSLRGYNFKEFENGDRMILGNVEYRIYGKKSRLDEINVVLFADAGLVWNAKDNTKLDKSFDRLTWDALKTDVGLALSNYEGNVRFTLAKRLDDTDKPLVLTFRIRRPF